MNKLTLSEIVSLYDDESAREKNKIMGKWDIVFDDSRNPEVEWDSKFDEFAKFGKKYKITLIVEEIGDADVS